MFRCDTPAAQIVITVSFGIEFDAAFVANPIADRHLALSVAAVGSSQQGNAGAFTNNVHGVESVLKFTTIPVHIEFGTRLGQVEIHFVETNERRGIVVVGIGAVRIVTLGRGDELVVQVARLRKVALIIVGRISAGFVAAQVEPQRFPGYQMRTDVAAVEIDPCIEARFAIHIEVDNLGTPLQIGGFQPVGLRCKVRVVFG